MAITTNFTNLKGNSIEVVSTTTGTNPGDDTIIFLGEFLPNGTEVTPNVRTEVTVQGGRAGTVTTASLLAPVDADGADGDIHIKTDTDDLYVKVSGTWGTPTDLTGATGAPGAGYSNVSLDSSSQLVFTGTGGNADVTTGSLKGDKGNAGSGFNAYDTTGNTTYNIGDTVISNNADDTPTPTQWRALTESLGTVPIEGDDWSELITRSQDVAGGTTTFPITTVDTAAVGYVTVTLTDNPDPIPGGFPGFRLLLSSDGTAYNKFNSDTPTGVNRSNLLFTTASGLDITNSGFQGIDGGAQQYRFFRFDNSAGLTAAEIATDTAAEITAGQDCSLANNLVDNNGETWNLDVTANGDMIELRATGGDNLSATFEGVNGGNGWTGSTVDPVVIGDFIEVTADNPFNIGDFVVDNSIVYVCKESYTTATTDSRPVGDATHWKDISS